MGDESIKKILVITSSIDVTVDYLIDKYGNLANFYRINVDNFDTYKVVVNNDLSWCISSNDWNDMLQMKDVFSIYYRKPRFPDLSDYEPAYRNMINYDILTLINGIVDSFEGKVLTKPHILRKCENKVFQLIYAIKKDIHIPTSFIGNDTVTLNKLFEGEAIIKPISTAKVYKNNSVEIYQTNYFENSCEDISMTPIYVQNYVNKSFEVRMTIVDGNVYPVKIESQNLLDWRKSYNDHKYSLVEVPKDILNMAFKIMDDFDLNFAAFDYIVNKDNEWIFLEVNPNGQWYWLEKALNLKISNGIINYLLG